MSSTAQINEQQQEEEEEDEEEHQRRPISDARSDSSRAVNLSFLPPRVRTLYEHAMTQSIDSRRPPASPVVTALTLVDIEALGLTLVDFLRELEQATTPQAASAALMAMTLVVAANGERDGSVSSLPLLVQTTRAVEPWIEPEEDTEEEGELARSVVAFVQLFHASLGG